MVNELKGTLYSIVCLLITFLALNADDDKSGSNVPDQSCKITKITPEKITICPDEYVDVEVTTSPAGCKISWSGEGDPKEGDVVGSNPKKFSTKFDKEGEYTITVKCGTDTKTVLVTVTEITHPDVEICDQSRGKLIQPKGGTPPYIYNSRNPAAVKIVKGVMKPVLLGQSKIIITDSKGCKGEFYADVVECDDYEEPPTFSIKGIDFLSHEVMRNYKSDFKSAGVKYKKTEWIKGSRNEPCTIPKDLNTSVTMSIEVSGIPEGSDVFKIIGTGHQGFNYKEDITLKNGGNIVRFKSTDKLKDQIHLIDDTIEWKILRGQDEIVHEEATGKHKVYVIAGMPHGSTPTEWRINWAVELCSGLSKAQDCADKIHKFTVPLYGRIPDRNEEWIVAEGKKAQCSDLAIFMNKAVSIIGWPAGEIRFLSVRTNTKVNVSSKAYNVQKRDEGRGIESLHFFDKGNGTNAYEACFYYEAEGKNVFYGGGAISSEDPLEVLKSIVKYPYWFLAPKGRGDGKVIEKDITWKP